MLKKIKQITRPARLAIKNIIRIAGYKLKRIFHPPVLPTGPNNKTLIHLGCGEQNAPGWINIDAEPFPHVHFVNRIDKLPMIRSESADLIYACHVLEHIPYLDYPRILEEWHRVLNQNGILRISVPDFDKLLSIYQYENNSLDLVLPPLMGAQDYEHGFHRGAFNEKYLTTLFTNAGFRKVNRWDPHTAENYEFNDWAKKLVHGKYPISLNLEAQK